MPAMGAWGFCKSPLCKHVLCLSPVDYPPLDLGKIHACTVGFSKNPRHQWCLPWLNFVNCCQLQLHPLTCDLMIWNEQNWLASYLLDMKKNTWSQLPDYLIHIWHPYQFSNQNKIWDCFTGVPNTESLSVLFVKGRVVYTKIFFLTVGS